MVMKICPKWKMDSAAELAVKNWYVQKKSKNWPAYSNRAPKNLPQNTKILANRSTQPMVPSNWAWPIMRSDINWCLVVLVSHVVRGGGRWSYSGLIRGIGSFGFWFGTPKSTKIQKSNG